MFLVGNIIPEYFQGQRLLHIAIALEYMISAILYMTIEYDFN